MEEDNLILEEFNVEDNNDNSSFHIDRYVADNNNALKKSLEQRSIIAHKDEIVSSNEIQNIIGVTDIDNSYAILFYDRKNNYGIACNTNSDNKVEMLKEMINKLGNEKLIIEYSIIVGYQLVEQNDYSGYNDLLYYLEVYSPNNIDFIPNNTEIKPKKCKNKNAYEFAFDLVNSTIVSDDLFD